MEFVDDSKIQYITSTMKGYSGLQLFNDYWRLAGQPHVWGNLCEHKVKTKTLCYRNEGIRVSAIIDDLTGDFASKVLQN